MIFGLGGVPQGRQQKIKEKQAIRSENAALYSDYIRLNPDVSAEESAAFASNLASGSEFQRNSLPSVEAMKSRVSARQRAVAAANEERALKRKRANQDEISRAAEVFSHIAVAAPDTKTATEQFLKSTNGVWGSAVVGADGTLNSAVSGLGMAQAKKLISGEVNAALQAWSSTSNPDTFTSSVLGTVTNKDLASGYANIGAGLVATKRQNLTNALPSNSKADANNTRTDNPEGKKVGWAAQKQLLEPYFRGDENGLEKQRQIYENQWEGWNKRVEAEELATNQAIEGKTAKFINDFVSNPENLVQIESEEQLLNKLWSEVQGEISSASSIKSLNDLPLGLKNQVKAAWEATRIKATNQLQQQEKATINEIQQTTKSNFSINEQLNKDRGKVVDGVAQTYATFPDVSSDDDNKRNVRNAADKFINDVLLLSDQMMLDISQDGYFNNLLAKIQKMTDIQMSGAFLDQSTILKGMVAIARNSVSQGGAIDAAISETINSDKASVGTFDDIMNDESTWDTFGYTIQAQMNKKIDALYNVIPDELGADGNAPTENNLTKVIEDQNIAISDLITGGNGLDETISDLKLIAETKITDINTDVLETAPQDAKDKMLIAREAIEELQSFETNMKALINGNLVPLTSDQRVEANKAMMAVAKRKNELVNKIKELETGLIKISNQAIERQSAKSSGTRSENMLDQMKVDLDMWERSNDESITIEDKIVQIVDEQLKNFSADDFQDFTNPALMAGQGDAASLSRDMLAPTERFGRGLREVTGAYDNAARGKMRLDLIDILRNEAGYGKLNREDVMVDKIDGGFGLQNQWEEIQQGASRFKDWAGSWNQRPE